LNTIQTPLMVEEVKTMDENQEKIWYILNVLKGAFFLKNII
jgi:hypothetical protein